MRTDGDTWDLASSVGATATGVAASRALASRGPDPLISDPYAAILVRAVGVEHFVRVADGELDLDADPLLNARQVCERDRCPHPLLRRPVHRRGRRRCHTGGDPGLRAGYPRLPAELARGLGGVRDRPVQRHRVQATGAGRGRGVAPAAEHRTIGIDLRDDWPRALRDAGFDPAQPTAWIAEGLLIYLPPDAQDRLLDDITALSAPGSRLATEYHPDGGAGLADRSKAISDQWRERGLELNMADLFYAGDRNPVIGYLEGQGWDVNARARAEVFAAYGRPFPETNLTESLRNSLSVNAIRK